MNKKDEWITMAVNVLRKVEFGGTELYYGIQMMRWETNGKTCVAHVVE